MCGIVGFQSSAGSNESRVGWLDAMLQAIHHRGPDSLGKLTVPDCGLHAGMRRLSIIDLEGGHQPVYNADRSIAVLFNGEIYNHRELRSELAGMGYSFQTNCDTEVLAHGYEAWGKDLPRRLRGMFAFSIWDARKRELFLARDHFGQKPLYYYQGPGGFAYASEIKALRTVPWVNRERNPNALLGYLTWFCLPAPHTHYRYIKKLEPGHALVFRPDSGSLDTPEKFWAYGDGVAPSTFSSIEEAAEALEEVLGDSVKLHLQADVPVGIFLSGGLDSQMVARLGARYHTGDLQAFTVVFSGMPSEGPEASATAARLGLRHHLLEIRHEELLAEFSALAGQIDEPVGDPAAFAVGQVSRLARQHVKVVLSGEGSDELFAGYAGRYSGALRNLSRLRSWKHLRRLLPTYRGVPDGRATRFWRRVTQTPGSEIASLRHEGLPLGGYNGGGLTAEAWGSLMRLEDQWGDMVFGKNGGAVGLEELLAFDMRWQLPGMLLVKADKMSMAESLELRTPFLDREVAHFAASLPAKMKLDTDAIRGKLVVRALLDRLEGGKAPDPPKLGFPMPFGAWFRGPLREAVADLVLSPDAAILSVIQPEAVRWIWDHVQAGNNELVPMLYALWLYEAWNRDE